MGEWSSGISGASCELDYPEKVFTFQGVHVKDRCVSTTSSIVLH